MDNSSTTLVDLNDPQDPDLSSWRREDLYKHWTCALPGCEIVRHSRSIYCSKHRRSAASRGDPRQLPIRRADIQKYRDKVQQTYEATRSGPQRSPLWSTVQERWDNLITQASLFVEAADRGEDPWKLPVKFLRNEPINRKNKGRYHVNAFKHLLLMDRHMGWEFVMVNTAAVFILQEIKPEKFLNDTTFDYALIWWAGKIRDKTGEMSAQEKMRHYPSRLSHGTKRILAQCIRETFGIVGLQLGRLEALTIDDEDDVRRRLSEGLERIAEVYPRKS